MVNDYGKKSSLAYLDLKKSISSSKEKCISSELRRSIKYSSKMNLFDTCTHLDARNFR